MTLDVLETIDDSKTVLPVLDLPDPMQHNCFWPKCTFKAPSKTALSCHEAMHLLHQPYKFEEPNCVRQYKLKGQLATHIKTHQRGSNFACSICGQSFRFMSNLRDHRQIHFEFRCRVDGCNRKFEFRKGLNAHMIKKHQ